MCSNIIIMVMIKILHVLVFYMYIYIMYMYILYMNVKHGHLCNIFSFSVVA